MQWHPPNRSKQAKKKQQMEVWKHTVELWVQALIEELYYTKEIKHHLTDITHYVIHYSGVAGQELGQI